MNNCKITQVDIPVNNNGSVSIKLHCIWPNDLAKENQPALIYSHSGNGMFISPRTSTFFCCRTAITCKCPVFNVEYRLSPQNKQTVKVATSDVYEAIKFVYNNAMTLGVDKSKLCITGYSGGGMLTMAAAYLLQKNNEANMVKASFLVSPLLSG